MDKQGPLLIMVTVHKCLYFVRKRERACNQGTCSFRQLCCVCFFNANTEKVYTQACGWDVEKEVYLVSIERVSFNLCIFFAHSSHFEDGREMPRDRSLDAHIHIFVQFSVSTWLTYVLGMWEETRGHPRKHKENQQNTPPRKNWGEKLRPFFFLCLNYSGVT